MLRRCKRRLVRRWPMLLILLTALFLVKQLTRGFSRRKEESKQFIRLPPDISGLDQLDKNSSLYKRLQGVDGIVLSNPKFRCPKSCTVFQNLTRGLPPVFKRGGFSTLVGSYTIRDMSDAVIAWPYQKLFQLSRESAQVFDRNVNEIAPCLTPVPVIYFSLDQLALVNGLVRQFPFGAVLVIGQSEEEMDERRMVRLLDTEDKIISLFAVNALFDHARLTPIPLGVSAQFFTSEIQHLVSTVKVSQTYYRQYLLSILNDLKFQNGTEKKLAVANFALTNKKRIEIWDKYCSPTRSNIPWLDCLPRSTEHSAKINQTHIYTRLQQYPVWLCPRENGPDSSCVWEAFYMGRVPLVEQSALDTLLDDLPVVFVPRLSDLSLTYIVQQLKQLSMKTFAMAKLRAGYWQSLIEDARMSELWDLGFVHPGMELDPAIQTRPRCWGPKP